MMISQHFSIDELTHTNVRLINRPGPVAIDNLGRLARAILEPMRELVIPRYGRKVGAVHVDSAFRAPDVNAAVGGAGNSAHLYGRAGDVLAVDRAVTVFDLMTALLDSQIEFDQAIYEKPADSAWLHVQVRDLRRPPRRSAVMCLAPRVYEAWNPNDPRIRR